MTEMSNIGPPASCVLHEMWLKEVMSRLDIIARNQQDGIQRMETKLDDFREKTEEQITRLWNNGLRTVDARVTRIEERGKISLKRRDGDSPLIIFKRIPSWAYGIAVIVWGPKLFALLVDLIKNLPG